MHTVAISNFHLVLHPQRQTWDTKTQKNIQQQIIWDLGQVAKLNRFKLYQRGGSELYKHGNPKRFEIYGRLNLDNLPIYDPDDPGDGWIFLGYFQLNLDMKNVCTM